MCDVNMFPKNYTMPSGVDSRRVGEELCDVTRRQGQGQKLVDALLRNVDTESLVEQVRVVFACCHGSVAVKLIRSAYR